MSSKQTISRRRYLALWGASITWLAGCTTGSDDNGDDSGAPEPEPTSSPSPTKDSEATSTDVPEDTDTDTPESLEADVVIGEAVGGDNLSMVVRDVSKTAEIGEFQQADGGNTFVVVNLVVKNTTQDEFINFSGFLQTSLKDSEDYSYSQSIAVTDNTFSGGQLVPGEVARGDIVFEIPEDATGLTLLFDFQTFALFKFDRVVVDLETTASTRADLDQDLRVDVNSVGDEVTFGDTSVSVNEVEFTEQVSSYATADEGNEFAIIDIATTNGTDEEQYVSTLLQMLVKDGVGKSYQISITAQSQIDRAYDESSPLGPGETRRGKVAYEVPKDESPLYWIFEFTLWTKGDKTFWRLR